MKKFYQRAITTVAGSIYAVFALTPFAHADLQVPDVNQYTGSLDILGIIGNVGTWMMGLAGVLAVVYLIYGGIVYITGGAKAAESAKTIIINSIIGLVVIALSYVIFTTVFEVLEI
ncbi:MAG: hypothetical protein V1807_01365 [Patescibacteria group bacterium]